MSQKKIAFVSTFPPQQCEVATFTQDLIQSFGLPNQSGFKSIGVAVTDQQEWQYDYPVSCVIRRQKPNDYRRVADILNMADIDLVCVQYGINLFGGPQGAGEYLDSFLSRVEAPVVSTLHTFSLEPSQTQYRMIRSLMHHSEKLVVMSQADSALLNDVYGIGRTKLQCIPKGVPDIPFYSRETMKQPLGLRGRTTILMADSLSSQNGAETVVRALPEIIKKIPDALFILLGTSDSEATRLESELQWHQLETLVDENNLHQHVVFQKTLLHPHQLFEYIQAADVYVTPNQNANITHSTSLAYAVGLGCAIVSTPYKYAKELLAGDCGRLTPTFDNVETLSKSIIALLSNPNEHQRVRHRAYRKGRKMIWPVVSRTYQSLFMDTLQSNQTLLFPTTEDTQDETSIGSLAS